MRTPAPPGTEEAVFVAPGNATQLVLTFDDNSLASALFGQYGQNLALIERKLGVAANSRGNQVTIDGTRRSSHGFNTKREASAWRERQLTQAMPSTKASSAALQGPKALTIEQVTV